MKAGAGQRLESVELGAEIGEEDGDELCFCGQRRQRLDDLDGVGRRRQGEFHIIDACRDDLFKVAQRMRDVVRQLDDGADRAAAVDEGDDLGDGVQGQGAQRAARGRLAVDDVGAAREGDLRLFAGENARQHQGHEFLAPVVAQRASARLWSKFCPNPSGLARLPSCSRWAPPAIASFFPNPKHANMLPETGEIRENPHRPHLARQARRHRPKDRLLAGRARCALLRLFSSTDAIGCLPRCKAVAVSNQRADHRRFRKTDQITSHVQHFQKDKAQPRHTGSIASGRTMSTRLSSPGAWLRGSMRPQRLDERRLTGGNGQYRTPSMASFFRISLSFAHRAYSRPCRRSERPPDRRCPRRVNGFADGAESHRWANHGQRSV